MLEHKNMKLLKYLKQNRLKKGFILPLTLLVCSIILTVATGISVILTKELYFSKVSRESQLAYYAADTGMMCALMVDGTYIDGTTGLGIFPYDGVIDPTIEMQAVLDKVNYQRQLRNLSTLILSDIKCATAPIFDVPISGFNAVAFSRTNSAGVDEVGRTSTFDMRMNLGDGTTRCAMVVISKTSKYRQIISRGFAACEGASHNIERAIINTTEVK